jgi:hypothetical protein
VSRVRSSKTIDCVGRNAALPENVRRALLSKKEENAPLNFLKSMVGNSKICSGTRQLRTA